MKANEEGLTKGEKIMFSALGVILVVALGVLIVNNFSNNNRSLTNETQEEKCQTQVNISDEKEDETINDEKEILKEEKPSTPSSGIVNTSSTIKNPNKKPSTGIVLVPENPKPEPVIQEWDFLPSLKTEAYENDEIIIDNRVMLKDNTFAEAVVTIRKLEGNSYNIVELINNRFIATPGLYKYYYTYSNITKEKVLIVYENLKHEKLEILSLNDYTFTEDISITEDEYNKLKDNNSISSINLENNIYNITLTKELTEYKKIALVITLEEGIFNIKNNGENIKLSKDTESWHQTLETRQVIIWLDLENIEYDKENNMLFIYNDNINAVIKYKVTLKEPVIITPDSEQNTELPEINEDNKSEEVINPEDSSSLPEVTEPIPSEDQEVVNETENNEVSEESEKSEEINSEDDVVFEEIVESEDASEEEQQPSLEEVIEESQIITESETSINEDVTNTEENTITECIT